MDEKRPGIRPRPTLWRRLDSAARAALPATSAALLMLLFAAPLGLVGQAQLQQAVALACVFFWSVFRPASMPPAAVFMLGLLTDLLDLAPVGVMVLILLVVHGLAVRFGRVLARQGFLLVWLVFVGGSVGAAVLGWALTSLLLFRLLPPGPAAFQAALSAGVYPMLALVFTRAHRGLADPQRA